MTRKSKREIESKLNELDSESEAEERSLGEVWRAGLRGEDVDVSREEWARMLEDAKE